VAARHGVVASGEDRAGDETRASFSVFRDCQGLAVRRRGNVDGVRHVLGVHFFDATACGSAGAGESPTSAGSSERGCWVVAGD